MRPSMNQLWSEGRQSTGRVDHAMLFCPMTFGVESAEERIDSDGIENQSSGDSFSIDSDGSSTLSD